MGIEQAPVIAYSKTYFFPDDSMRQRIINCVKYCQILSRYDVPFVNRLVEAGILDISSTCLNDIAMSKTQPIFSLCHEKTIYECKLRHTFRKVNGG